MSKKVIFPILLGAILALPVNIASANIITDIALAPVRGAIAQTKATIGGVRTAIGLGKKVLGQRQAKVPFKTALARMQTFDGKWYDDKGNQKLRINKNSINGHKMMGGYDFTAGDIEGEGTFRTSTGRDSHKDIRIQWMGQGQHRSIVVDNQTLMQKKPEERTYSASIGGLYLGMSERALQERMGKPSKKTKDDWDQVWQYDAHGLTVYLTGKSIVGIVLDSDSDLQFDQAEIQTMAQDIYAGPQARQIADGEYLVVKGNPKHIGLFMSDQGDNNWQ